MVRLLAMTVMGAGVLVAHHFAGAATGRNVTVAVGPSDQVIVDPAGTKRLIPSSFFGINYVGFWDDAAGSRASAKALAQTPIRTVRFPGGAPADWYDWQAPFYQGWSHSSPMQVWRYAQSFGGRRVLFATNYQGHQPHPPHRLYTVNSPQNAAAWVTYDKKVGIRAYMEVGNEEDMNLLHTIGDPAYATYIAGFNAQARAMHRIDPHVKVLGPVGTNEYFWWGLDGLGQFLSAAGNRTGTGQVDGISLHFYKGSSWLDTRSVAQYWVSQSGPWAAIQKALKKYDSRNLPVYITEWNVGGADSKSAFGPTLGHALVNADMIGAFASSGVAGENYFDTHGGQTWGLLYGKGEDRPLDSPTPTYYAMALWKHMGARVIPLEQSDDAGTRMSSYATIQRNGSVQVLAINKTASSRKVTVGFQGASPAGHDLHVNILQGRDENVNDRIVRYNGVTMPSPQQHLPASKDLGVVRGRAVSYTVPGHSAVVLDLAGLTQEPKLHWKKVLPSGAVPSVAFKVRGDVGVGRVKLGKSIVLTAQLESNQDTGTILVDMEVYSSSNVKVSQYVKTVDLMAKKLVAIADTFTPTGTAPFGTYHLKIGVFGLNWNPLYVWKDDAGSFQVTRS